MRHKKIVRGVLAVITAASAIGIGQLQPVSAAIGGQNATRKPARVRGFMVKFKPASALGTLQTDGFERSMALNRMATAMSQQAGAELAFSRDMSGEAQVFDLAAPVDAASADQIAANLAAMPEVESAEPDAMMYALLTPDDEFYGDQWHFANPASGDFGIDAERAWDITTGASNIYVAVLDTGILKSHPDFAGRHSGGYDLVSTDPTDPDFTRDGNGRDPDASDPGDYVSSAESNDVESDWYRCSTSSSWHGSHVGGTIGAAGNNASGVAGINWVSKVIPVRVLAKCGAGSSSDIVDGIRWAVGMTVPGTNRNPTPARVLNLSLGGPGPCTALYQSAINDANSTGAIVVVAAGNENLDVASSRPANCNGVISVAATTRTGARATYSNFGARVTIAGPGGASPSTGAGVLSTLNGSSTTPGAMTYGYEVGTSMAAPHVAGVVSLMLSQRSYLTAPRVIEILRTTATPFPAGSTCITKGCGAGIVNAFNAVTFVDTLPTLDRKILLPLARKGASPTTRLRAGGGKVNSPVKSSTGPAQTAPASCVIKPFKRMLPLVGVTGAVPAAAALSDGAFETQPSAWQVASSANFKGIYTTSDPDWVRVLANVSPNSGSAAVWFRSCTGFNERASVSQRIALPADARFLTFFSLTFSREAKEGTVCPPNDIARVLIDGVALETRNLCETLDANGNPVVTGWQQTSLDISASAGRTVTLSFEFASDEQDGSNWLIDDVAISPTL